MKRVVAFAVLLGAFLFAGVSPAQAATYEKWRFRDGQICYQDHGSSRWDGTVAASKWNASDVNIVSRDTCTGYSRGMIIDLKLYNDPNDRACAKTGSNSYSWEYVWSAGKVAKWVPNLMVVWVNTAPSLAAQCTATSSMRAHLLSHEIGHALGLGHPTGSPVSVMAAWKYTWPQPWDLANANGIY
jgi:hypothetical protein